MKTEFNIDYRTNEGRLHISLVGTFNDTCAWALLKTIKRYGSESSRVFVSTAKLQSIKPEGVALFKLHMSRKRPPADWLYFKGEKGFKIAPDGSRVIIPQKKVLDK